LRQLIAQPAIARAPVRSIVRVQPRVPARAGVVVDRLDLPLAWLREVEEGAIAVDLPRHLVVGLGGFTGCGKVSAAPRMIADCCTEAAPDLLDAAITQSVVMRRQRVAS